MNIVKVGKYVQFISQRAQKETVFTTGGMLIINRVFFAAVSNKIRNKPSTKFDFFL